MPRNPNADDQATLPPWARPLRTPLGPLLARACQQEAAATSRLTYLVALAARPVMRRRPARA